MPGIVKGGVRERGKNTYRRKWGYTVKSNVVTFTLICYVSPTFFC